MNANQKLKKLPILAGILSALSASNVVYSQEAAFTLEEVVVTARKRDESLQEVPEAVTVMGEGLIYDAGIDGLDGIAKVAPNVHLNDSFRKGTIRLNVRGIGTPQFSDPPVSFVVDGATVPDPEFINQGIFDVENIQVLRGPQGALYGQGALAGAILITSKQPTNELLGNIQFDQKSGNDTKISGSASGAIIEDKLMFRVGGYYQDKEGLTKNVLGEHVDYIEGAYSVRGMLKYIVSDNLDMTLSVKSSDGEYGYGIQYDVTPDEINKESAYKVANSNYVGYEPQASKEVSFQINWDLGFGDLTSVTGYGDIEDSIWLEGDGNISESSIQYIYNNIDGFSQELRLSSPDDQDFRWIVGGNYRTRTNEYLSVLLLDPGDNSFPIIDPVGAPTSGTPRVRNARTTKFESRALFVFGSYDLTDALELTAAIRYDGVDIEESAIIPAVDADRSVDYSEIQPKLGLSYQVTEDAIMYASYSRGFRSGGFNGSNYFFQPGTYDSELSDSYEVGLKSTWIEGRVNFNVSAYMIDMTNYQLTVFSSESASIGNMNLDDVPITGIELEVKALLSESLTLDVSYGYTDADIESFIGDGSATDLAISGNKVPFNPPYTFNASLTHIVALNDAIDLRTYLSYRQSGDIYFRQDNRGVSKTRRYGDLKMTLDMEQWDFSLFVNNMFDYREAVHLFGTSAPTVTPNTPRTYGVSVRFEF